MINIRYHIVSITAVFLALGIGVALGSTFLDRATVDLLNNRIAAAEGRIDDTDAENRRLRTELERADERDAALIVTGSEDLLADHLTDVPVLVVSAPGVEGDALAALSTVLERTGADLAGTLTLSDRLAFPEDADLDLAADLELPGEPNAAALKRQVSGMLDQALLRAGEPAPTLPPDELIEGEVTPPEVFGQPSIVTALLDRGYLNLAPGPGAESDEPILERTGYRYVFVGGPMLDDAQDGVLLDLVAAQTNDPLPAVIVSGTVPGDEDVDELVPTVVAQVRSDDDLAATYSTVDNIDTFAGLTAMVQILQAVEVGDVGHYGQADGATAVLPPAP